MRWTPGGVSDNIEDRRGSSGMGFGGGGIRLGLGGFILVAILSLVFKTNFFSLLGGGDGGSPASGNRGRRKAALSTIPTSNAKYSLSASYSTMHRIPGSKSCPSTVCSIATPSWCCFAMR